MVEMFNWRICYIFPVFRLLLLASLSGAAKTFGEQSKARSKQVAILKSSDTWFKNTKAYLKKKDLVHS